MDIDQGICLCIDNQYFLFRFRKYAPMNLFLYLSKGWNPLRNGYFWETVSNSVAKVTVMPRRLQGHSAALLGNLHTFG